MSIGDYCTIDQLVQGSVFEYQNFKYVKVQEYKSGSPNAIDGTFKQFQFDSLDRLIYCGRAGIVALSCVS